MVSKEVVLTTVKDLIVVGEGENLRHLFNSWHKPGVKHRKMRAGQMKEKESTRPTSS